MKKEKFSFVKWLTNKDIEKILSSMNIEIMKRNDDSNRLKILRGKDANGERSITVFCINNNPDKNKEARDLALKEMMKYPPLRGFMSSIFMTNALIQSMNPNANFSQYNNMVILKFDDYFVTEILSLKTEDEQLEFDRELTKNYQNYMTKKFGRFYNSMKSAYYKKLHKQIREEENSKENETTDYEQF